MGQITIGAPAASITAPSVAGTGGVGVPQTCSGDTWSSWAGQQPTPGAPSDSPTGYQWLLNGRSIAGATGTSYTPTPDEDGQQLSCDVTATYELLAVTVSAKSAGIEVKGAAKQLGELANAVTGVGPGASLSDKVAAIEADVAANDTQDACSGLAAFSNEVDAQTGKKLDPAQAASLLDGVQGIEAALNC